jgi:hypothetical protein
MLSQSKEPYASEVTILQDYALHSGQGLPVVFYFGYIGFLAVMNRNFTKEFKKLIGVRISLLQVHYGSILWAIQKVSDIADLLHSVSKMPSSIRFVLLLEHDHPYKRSHPISAFRFISEMVSQPSI